MPGGPNYLRSDELHLSFNFLLAQIINFDAAAIHDAVQNSRTAT